MDIIRSLVPWSIAAPPPAPTFGEKAVKVAIFTGKIVVRGLAAAAVLYVTGLALSQLGHALAGAATSGSFTASSLELASKALVSTADVVSWLGGVVFKCIAVPIYAVGYVLPRWIITEGLPQLATDLRTIAVMATDIAWQSLQWLAREVIAPAAEFVITVLKELPSFLKSVAETIFAHVLQPVYTYLVQPAYQFAVQTLQTIGTILADSLAWSFDKIVTCLYMAKDAITYVFSQAVDTLIYMSDLACRAWSNIRPMAEWVVQEVIHPAIQGLVDGCTWIGNNVLQPLAEAAKTAVVWMATTMLECAKTAWGYLTLAMETAALWAKTLLEGAEMLARWTFTNVISPALETGIWALKQAWQATSYLVEQIFHTISKLWNTTAAAIEWLRDRIVIPAITAAIEAVVWVAKNAIWPVISGAYSILSWIAMKIVVPAAMNLWYLAQHALNGMISIGSVIANTAGNLCQWVVDTLPPILQTVADAASSVWMTASVVFEQTVQPVLTSLQEGLWTALNVTQTSLVSLHEWIVETLQELGNSIVATFNSLPKPV